MHAPIHCKLSDFKVFRFTESLCYSINTMFLKRVLVYKAFPHSPTCILYWYLAPENNFLRKWVRCRHSLLAEGELRIGSHIHGHAATWYNADTWTLTSSTFNFTVLSNPLFYLFVCLTALPLPPVYEQYKNLKSYKRLVLLVGIKCLIKMKMNGENSISVFEFLWKIIMAKLGTL